MSRRTKQNRPLIPPSAEAVAKGQLLAEQQRRADACFKAVNAVLQEHGCVIQCALYMDSRGQARFTWATETKPDV